MCRQPLGTCRETVPFSCFRFSPSSCFFPHPRLLGGGRGGFPPWGRGRPSLGVNSAPALIARCRRGHKSREFAPETADFRHSDQACLAARAACLHEKRCADNHLAPVARQCLSLAFASLPPPASSPILGSKKKPEYDANMTPHPGLKLAAFQASANAASACFRRRNSRLDRKSTRLNSSH